MTAASWTPVSPTSRALISTGFPRRAWLSAAWVMAGGAPFGLMVTLVGAEGKANFFSSSTATMSGCSADPVREGPFPAMSQASM